MTVFVNGRSLVHRGSGGRLITLSTNLTGEAKIPIPYQNLALAKHAKNTATGFLCRGEPVCHLASYFEKSSGDEPGQYGGILSGTVNGIAEFVTAASQFRLYANMYLNGQPIVRAGDLMVSNCRNTPPASLLQEYGNQSSRQLIIQSSTMTFASYSKFTIIIYRFSPELAFWWEVKSRTNKVYYSLNPYSHFLNHQARQEIPVASGVSWLSLCLLGVTGNWIIVPVTKLKCPYAQPAVQVSEVRLRWDSKMPSLDVDDICGLLKYPQFFRYLSYRQVLSQPIQQLGWYSALTPAQKRLLENLSSQADMQQLPEGWIYIFKSEYLWREIYINQQGTYQEVDLQKDAGKNVRKSLGLPQETLLFILKLGNTVIDYEVAYSSCQWSWQRILDYGGLAPHDPRYQSRYRDPSSRIRRQHRFQKVSGKNLLAVIGSQSPRKRNGNIAKPSNLLAPIILVEHFLGFLDRAVVDVEFLLRNLLTLLVKISAQLEVQLALAVKMLLSIDKNNFDRLKLEFNRYLLSSYLQEESRQQVQSLIRQLQVGIAQLFAQIDMEVWRDFFTLESECYLKGFHKIANLLASSCLNSHRLDFCFKTDNTHDPPAGYQLLENIVQSQNFMTLLFPSASQGSDLEPGAFRAEKFTALYFPANFLQRSVLCDMVNIVVLCANAYLPDKCQMVCQQAITGWLNLLSADMNLIVDSSLSILLPKADGVYEERLRLYYMIKTKRNSVMTNHINDLLQGLTLVNYLNCMKTNSELATQQKNMVWDRYVERFIQCQSEQLVALETLPGLILMKILLQYELTRCLFFLAKKPAHSHGYSVTKPEMTNPLSWPLPYVVWQQLYRCHSLLAESDVDCDQTLLHWAQNNYFSWRQTKMHAEGYLQPLLYFLFKPKVTWLPKGYYQDLCFHFPYCSMHSYCHVQVQQTKGLPINDMTIDSQLDREEKMLFCQLPKLFIERLNLLLEFYPDVRQSEKFIYQFQLNFSLSSPQVVLNP